MTMFFPRRLHRNVEALSGVNPCQMETDADGPHKLDEANLRRPPVLPPAYAGR